MSESAKPPVFRVRFESYDDFLVEYGEHLKDGVLALPASDGLTPGNPVRIKLLLPDGAKLYLKGEIRERQPVSLETTNATEMIEVALDEFTPDQADALQRCVEGALEATGDGAARPMPMGKEPPMNLLVVDDSLGIRIELGDALRERGVRVRVAENGLVAIAAALKRVPDIILCDVEMPVMDGWTFLRMARARERLKDVPFVFFTRLTDDLSRLQGYRMGVEDYLPKTTPPDEIVARLRASLARRRPSGGDKLDSSGHLHGDLQHVRLGSLLSFLEAERRSGELSLDSGRDRAKLYLSEGTLVGMDSLGAFNHAHDRVFELLDWPRGAFEFLGTEASPPMAINPTPVTYLLMEHARRTDERDAMGD